MALIRLQLVKIAIFSFWRLYLDGSPYEKIEDRETDTDGSEDRDKNQSNDLED